MYRKGNQGMFATAQVTVRIFMPFPFPSTRSCLNLTVTVVPKYIETGREASETNID